MTGERASLRVRLFAIALAAALIPGAPLSILLLLQVRDAIYGRAFADARGRLTDVVQRCPEGRCPDIPGVRQLDHSCTARSERVGELLVLCENVPGGSIQIAQDLRPVREQLGTLSRRLLATLALMPLLCLSFSLGSISIGRILSVGGALLLCHLFCFVGASRLGAALLPSLDHAKAATSIRRPNSTANRGQRI